MKFIEAIVISICLSIGGFIYQCFKDIPDYNIQLERSYFQITAILIVYFFLKFKES